jgi:hypothetical protein
MKDNIKQWGKAAGVRAVKTAAQAALGVIGASAAVGEVVWPLVGSAALLAAIVSVLTSLAGVPEVEGGASVAKLGNEL